MSSSRNIGNSSGNGNRGSSRPKRRTTSSSTAKKKSVSGSRATKNTAIRTTQSRTPARRTSSTGPVRKRGTANGNTVHRRSSNGGVSSTRNLARTNGKRQLKSNREGYGKSHESFGEAVIDILSMIPRKLLVTLTVIIAVFIVYSLVDSISTAGKIHPGISVSGVDVGGLTVEQASAKIDEELSPLLEGKTLTFFTDQTTMDLYDGTGKTTSDDSGFPGYWSIDASKVGATIDGDALAHYAYQSTRGDGWFGKHLAAWFGHKSFDALVSCDFNSFENIVNSINSNIGTSVTNSDLKIADGVVTVTSSAPGELADTTALVEELSAGFLGDQTAFVAPMKTVEPTIDETLAQTAADKVTQGIASDITYTYGGSSWTLSTAQLGSMLSTKIDLGNNDPQLVPYVDTTKAASVLTSVLGDSVGTGAVNASFDVSSGSVVVEPSSNGIGPDLTVASQDTDDILFGDASSRTVTMVDGTYMPTFTTEQAQAMHITSLISSYTTSFKVTTAKATNVQVLVDMLTNTIIAPGGTFSFNDTVGDTTTDKGFVVGKVLAGGELVDGVGGGACQVASTIFNAAFDLGLQIDERHNHTAHFTNYPEGRDATISYGYYDLKFTNDTSTYMLMTLSYSDGNVTVDIWGTDPGRTVETQTSEWTPGEQPTTVTENDSEIATGVSLLTQGGEAGGSETVYRQVYDSAGTLIHNDAFFSSYSVQNEIIKVGTGPDTAAHTLEEYEAL